MKATFIEKHQDIETLCRDLRSRPEQTAKQPQYAVKKRAVPAACLPSRAPSHYTPPCGHWACRLGSQHVVARWRMILHRILQLLGERDGFFALIVHHIPTIDSKSIPKEAQIEELEESFPLLGALHLVHNVFVVHASITITWHSADALSFQMPSSAPICFATNAWLT